MTIKLAAFVSDSFRERLAQKQRDKIASEVARGDEAAVNARIGRFMFKKIARRLKSVFTKDNMKRFIHEAELSVVATASTTVNGFVNNPANQACTEAPRREPGRRPPRSGAHVLHHAPVVVDLAVLEPLCSP